MEKRIQSFFDTLEKTMKVIVAVLCIILLSMLFIQVLNRYVLGVSWPHLQFIIPFCFLWMCMIGIALAARRNEHFEVDILSKFLRGFAGKVHFTIVLLCVLLATIVTIWSAWSFVKLGLLKKNPANGFSMVYIYLSLFVGAVLVIVVQLERILNVYVFRHTARIPDTADPTQTMRDAQTLHTENPQTSHSIQESSHDTQKSSRDIQEPSHDTQESSRDTQEPPQTREEF